MSFSDHLSSLRIYARLPLRFVAELRAKGMGAALGKMHDFLFRRSYKYAEDFAVDTLQAELTTFPRQPRISIIMPVYNTPLKWLRAAVASVQQQIYPHWELCIADDHSTDPKTLDFLTSLSDPRIKIERLLRNRGIAGASNAAIGMATGEYLALLDHDDELTRDALVEVARVINADRPDVIYSDEDMILGFGRYLHHFKPDFSPDLLLSHNYITHLLVAEKQLLNAVGGFRTAYNGAQDYDLVLRLSERAQTICHIRKVLYHWRCHRRSTSLRAAAKPYTASAGRVALEDALGRRGINARVEEANLSNYYRIRRAIPDQPLISIIIPFRDQPELLETCVGSVLSKSTYANFEILGINNGSAEPATLEVIRELRRRDSRVRFHDYDIPFNYSRINNFAAGLARGEHLVLLNNDIEIITPGWLEALLEHSQRPDVGAVGGKLYYPDDTVQHGGVIVGIAGFAGHSHRHSLRKANGYFNRLHAIQNLSAVTGAMLMVKKTGYLDIGGLDEVHLGTSLNDVDFCLRLREAGYLNVFTPYAEAYHYESRSRGYETTPEKQQRFEREIAYFKARHKAVLATGDPYYNPNLTRHYENFRCCHTPPDSAARHGTVKTPESNRAPGRAPRVWS